MVLLSAADSVAQPSMPVPRAARSAVLHGLIGSHGMAILLQRCAPLQSTAAHGLIGVLHGRLWSGARSSTRGRSGCVATEATDGAVRIGDGVWTLVPAATPPPFPGLASTQERAQAHRVGREAPGGVCGDAVRGDATHLTRASCRSCHCLWGVCLCGLRRGGGGGRGGTWQ